MLRSGYVRDRRRLTCDSKRPQGAKFPRFPRTICSSPMRTSLDCRISTWPAVLRPRQREKLARGTKDEERAMSSKVNSAVAVIGIDIGKNSFHVIGQDKRALAS